MQALQGRGGLQRHSGISHSLRLVEAAAAAALCKLPTVLQWVEQGAAGGCARELVVAIRRCHY
jgi:hypothetical protein